MITEAIMLLSASLMFYLGKEIYEGYQETGKKSLIYLITFAFGSGLGLIGYVLRMVFMDYQILFYKAGGIIHGVGAFSGLMFAISLFYPKYRDKIDLLYAIPAAVAAVFWSSDLDVVQIPKEIYEPSFVERTELVIPTLTQITILPVVFLAPLLGAIVFLYYGYKENKVKPYYYGAGMAVSAFAFLLDSLAPWPSMVFLWRLMYGVSALLMLHAYRIEK